MEYMAAFKIHTNKMSGRRERNGEYKAKKNSRIRFV